LFKSETDFEVINLNTEELKAMGKKTDKNH